MIDILIIWSTTAFHCSSTEGVDQVVKMYGYRVVRNLSIFHYVFGPLIELAESTCGSLKAKSFANLKNKLPRKGKVPPIPILHIQYMYIYICMYIDVPKISIS